MKVWWAVLRHLPYRKTHLLYDFTHPSSLVENQEEEQSRGGRGYTSSAVRFHHEMMAERLHVTRPFHPYHLHKAPTHTPYFYRCYDSPACYVAFYQRFTLLKGPDVNTEMQCRACTCITISASCGIWRNSGGAPTPISLENHQFFARRTVFPLPAFL